LAQGFCCGLLFSSAPITHFCTNLQKIMPLSKNMCLWTACLVLPLVVMGTEPAFGAEEKLEGRQASGAEESKTRALQGGDGESGSSDCRTNMTSRFESYDEGQRLFKITTSQNDKGDTGQPEAGRNSWRSLCVAKGVGGKGTGDVADPVVEIFSVHFTYHMKSLMPCMSASEVMPDWESTAAVETALAPTV